MSTTGHESEAINVQGLKASLQKFKTDKVDGKSDKSATVSNVSYNSSTGKIQKTVNGTTTDVCDVVTSGFRITENDTTGVDNLVPVGGATLTENDTTGIDDFEF